MMFWGDDYARVPPISDIRLVNYTTYEDYLDSIYNEIDMCYVRNKDVCRQIAEYGYRKEETLSRHQFFTRRARAVEYLMPVTEKLISKDFKGGDPAQNALALRERPNRVGFLATIIFLNYTTPNNTEISGYIDYAHSLRTKNWEHFFNDNKPIYPTKTDLGYYDWKNDVTKINDSLFFKTKMSPVKGLLFQSKFDRMAIFPDPFAKTPGRHSRRTRIKSQMYDNFVLIDHLLRDR